MGTMAQLTQGLEQIIGQFRKTLEKLPESTGQITEAEAAAYINAVTTQESAGSKKEEDPPLSMARASSHHWEWEGEFTTKPHQEPVLALLNPNADPHEAKARYNGELHSNPSLIESADGSFSILCMMDDTMEDHDMTHDPESGPTTPSSPSSEALFTTVDPEQRSYQATGAMIDIEDLDGKRLTVKTIVDSGAARCVMDESFCRTYFPGHMAVLRKSDKRFHNASGQPMPVVGRIEMTFYIGACRLTTTVYVIRQLAVPFLFGVNAMERNGLVTDHHRRRLCVHPDRTDGEEHCIPLTVDTRSEELHLVDPPPGEHECATSEYQPPTELGGQADQCDQCRSSYQIRCDLDSQSLNVVENGGCNKEHQQSTVLASVGCFPAPLTLGNIQLGMQEPRAPSYSSDLVAVRDVLIKKGSRGHGVLAKFVDHTQDMNLSIEIRPNRAFLKRTGLITLDGQLHSQFNLNAFIHYDNRHGTSDVFIPKGEVIARAYQYARPASTTNAGDPAALMMMSAVKVRIDDQAAFADGGRPQTEADFIELGLDLSQSIDASRRNADGSYAALTADQKQQLYDAAGRWWWVWSRDARAPEVSRLVVIEIPTGDAVPIAQKPYPIPYAYREAVADELKKLIEGGLIEPTISQWASPMLVRLKKDSTPDKVRLKLIIDYRRLNQVTVPDAAGLGDQEEIMDGFGGDQRFGGIMDAAGGFYQFTIKPSDRHKTSFVLPTSMGGTSFQWRVAPYGLTRNPAGYSRGMMFAMQSLHTVSLAPLGESTGGVGTWIDDISLHCNSFEGFVDLFDRVLGRIAAASMQLKASKCLLLREKLEVLGFYVTPDGIVMQDSKLEALEKYDELGELVVPNTIEEIRTFLGTVQFYRRFIPRIALLGSPMTDMLKKGAVAKEGFTSTQREAVKQSCQAIMTFMQSDAVMSAPDLKDPLAEYVICPDACDVAAGGVLLQWQHPTSGGPGPPKHVPLRGGLDQHGKGTDPLTQSWRHAAGWRLRTISYYSKTFDKAQRNYPTFDKESAAILFCIRRWAKLITFRPTTVYTDSQVASSMLHKHLGPPRRFPGELERPDSCERCRGV